MISLSTITSEFKTDRTYIDDAILLMKYVAADVREAPNGMIVSDTTNGMKVSYQAYKWAIGFNVLITCKEQIAKMRQAITKNVSTLQPMIAHYENAIHEINKWTFFGSERIKKEYDRKIENGSISQNADYNDFADEIMGPLRDDHDIAKNRVYLGECDLHPNQYLKSLGIKQIRFESITPLYRD
jgi:hypothetical protein